MIKRLLFVGGLGAIGFGIYKYYRTQADILADSDVKLDRVELVKQTRTNVTLRFHVKVINNSEQKFTVKSFDFGLFVNDKFIGIVKNSNLNNVILPNGGSTKISFDFILNPSQINFGELLGGVLFSGAKTKLMIKGNVAVQKGIITVKAPLDINYSLKELIS